MKTIVTHFGPDLDAITSVWLVKTFLPEWREADVAFVPAGTTYKKLPPDDNPDMMHVDTGFGKFDHHQTDDDICASTLLYDHIKKRFGENKALERLTAVVNNIDHFGEVHWPDPTADYWEFALFSIIDGWRLIYPDDHFKIVAMGMDALDGIYKTFQNKIWAEKELETGREFTSFWGKAMALETINDEAVHLGQKRGYRMMIRKDPKKGYVRIKSYPDPDIDLTDTYEKLKKKDTHATWFLHASKHMILNGSAKNPDMKPTTLTLDEIVEIFKAI